MKGSGVRGSGVGRRMVALAGCLALVAAGSPAAAADAPAIFTVADAEFRWAVNDETNNAAFAPGTWNLLSAGTIGNPGAGGQSLNPTTAGRTWGNGAAAGWTSRAGTTTIEDLQADGTRAPATFDGTRQDASGASTSPPGSGVLAQTQVAMRAGAGTADPAAGTATLSWRGSFSVLYYSGMTYFVVSDPTLQVSPGKASVTATVSGYATSMADASKWTRLADERVTLAELGDPDLTADKGFSAAPRYLGVRYDAPADGALQVRSGASWGAFPTSLLRFLAKVGMASYWYSSGGTTDGKKVAAPITVSWDATSPVAAPVPPAVPRPAEPSVSLAPAPPAAAPTTAVTTRPAVPARPTLTATSPPTAPPAMQPVPAAPTPLPTAAGDRLPPHTAYAAADVAQRTASPTGDAREWWLGIALLLAAAAIAAAPYLHRHTTSRKARP